MTNANADNQSGSANCAAGAGADTIDISVAGTINLLSALPDMTSDMTINGLGAGITTVRRDSGAAATNFRIFFKAAGTATISNMMVRDGFLRGAHGANGETVIGGGINNGAGALTFSGIIVSNNQAIVGNGTSGAGGASFGGGISNSSPLTITNSIISGNTATDPGGNGIGVGITNLDTAIITARTQISPPFSERDLCILT